MRPAAARASLPLCCVWPLRVKPDFARPVLGIPVPCCSWQLPAILCGLPVHHKVACAYLMLSGVHIACSCSEEGRQPQPECCRGQGQQAGHVPGKSAAVAAGKPICPFRAATHHPLWLAEGWIPSCDAVCCCKFTCSMRQSRSAHHTSACLLHGQLLKYGTPEAATTQPVLSMHPAICAICLAQQIESFESALSLMLTQLSRPGRPHLPCRSMAGASAWMAEAWT